MKHILSKLLLALAVITASMSCTKDPAPVQYLEVNKTNIEGSWSLVSLNGEQLNAGTYFHITLKRNDNTFSISQNMNAFPEIGSEMTGRYDLSEDMAYGTIISGIYDHDAGFWAYDYIIAELSADSMKWTAKGNPDFVQEYRRLN